MTSMVSEDHEDIDDPAVLDIGLDLTEEEILDAMGDVDDMNLDEDISVIGADGEKDEGSPLNLNHDSNNENSNDDIDVEYNSDDKEINEIIDEQNQENYDQANREETEVRPEPPSTISQVDEILKKVYGIVKPICESVYISCEWKRSIKDQSGFIKVFNPMTDMYSTFFPLLHLIIYDRDGSLFIKLFYQQCKLFKKSEVKDALSRLNKSEEYIAIVTILASFISELSLNKYQPCQGTIEQSEIEVKNISNPRNQIQIIQNLLTEKQGNRKVYRTMNCNLLTEKGNNKCSECSTCYYEIFEQAHILFSSQIMGVLRDSRLKGMTFNDIFQSLFSRYYKHRKKSPQFVALIQETLIKDESFKEDRKEGVTYWKSKYLAISSKNKAREKIILGHPLTSIKDSKNINNEQNTNSVPKDKIPFYNGNAGQKKWILPEKANPLEYITAIEKIVRPPLPSLQNNHLVKNGFGDKVSVQGQDLQKPIHAHVLSRVVMKKNEKNKQQPQSTEKMPFQSSSQQATFNPDNVPGPTVRPVINLNSIFERGHSKPKLIGREVFLSTVATLQSPSHNSVPEKEQQNKGKHIENTLLNQARIVSTKTGNVVKYW